MSRSLVSLLGLASAVAIAAACSAVNSGSTFGGDGNGTSGNGGGGTTIGTTGGGDDGQGGGLLTGTGGHAQTGTGTVCNHDANQDGDGDGYTGAQGDCNDCDPNVNPGAVDARVETDAGPGDVFDNNCDGKAELPQPCDDNLAMDSTDPMAGAQAIELCQTAGGNDKKWGVLSAKYVRADGSPFNPGKQVGIQTGFGPNVHVQGGKHLLVLSSGYSRMPGQPGACDSESCTSNAPGNAPPGFPQDVPNCQGDQQINDDVGLEVQLRAPTNATGYRFLFKFQSFEFPEWVCTSYNDQFIALVNPPPKGSINGNVSFDSKSNPVSVNIAFFDACDPGGIGAFGQHCNELMQGNPCPNTPNPYCPSGPKELTGTGFDNGFGAGGDAGATSWLMTESPIKGGDTFSIRFAIWDTGDQNLDSTVLVDNFEWVANGGTVAIGTAPIPTPK
jgi:hypothetical protein